MVTTSDSKINELVINKLTNEQYKQALIDGQIKEDELYITTDDEESATKADLETKQDILVSGTNIKTINNESILGSGNIEIQGGSGGSKVIFKEW